MNQSDSARAEDGASVVIVGGGPVGMGLAIELGQRGIECVVVERYAEPQPIPKGQNLTQRTMEHFHAWGAEPALRAARTIPSNYGIGGLTAYGTLLGEYSHDWLQRDLVRQYYFQANERLPQYATEAVLRGRVKQLPTVQTLYGWQAETVTQDADAAHVSVVERDGGRRSALRGAYVVGCDGSRSIVREQVGIAQQLTDHDRLMVLLVFRSIGLHELLARYPGKSFYNVLQPELKGYWKFFGRVDLGSTWFFHAPVPPGTTKDNFDFVSYLHEAAGASFDVEMDYVGFWDLRFAIAERYRSRRVFIAGDAAHSHPPYGGYGVNTGFEDARNLGWKLAASLQGWGDEILLDSYDTERRPVFASTAGDFIAQAIDTDRSFLERFDPAVNRAEFERAWGERTLGAVGEVHSFEPNYEGSPVVGSPRDAAGRGGSAVGTHSFIARAGHHLSPATLSNGRNVYDEMDAGFTLLALGAKEPSVQALRAAAASLHVPLTVITDTREGERARYEASLVLVRPDNFVAWAGDDLPGGGDAQALLGRACGLI